MSQAHSVHWSYPYYLDMSKNETSVVDVPGDAKHAFRNVSDEPVVQLITTTAHLGRFFEEIGRPIVPGGSSNPPTPEEIQQLVQASAEYRYWLGSPAENAEIGLPM